MEENQAKMHSMISSVASVKNSIEYYNKAVEKYNFVKIRTAQDALKNDCPTLIEIKNKLTKEGKPEYFNNMLGYMVAAMAKSFNLARNIDVSQIPSVVETIQAEYYFIKLSEIYFIFREARMGRFGKTYERMDEPTIIGWFDNYVENRLNTAEQESLRNHDQNTYIEKERKYEGFISNLHREQEDYENKRIHNLAFSMAKKMANSDNFNAPVYKQNNQNQLQENPQNQQNNQNNNSSTSAENTSSENPSDKK